MFLTKEIPLEVYQNSFFDVASKNKTMEIIKEAIVELNIQKEETIQMCRGNVFDLARLYLKENGFKVEDTKIEGKLQLMVEQAYLSLLEKLGVDINKISLEAGRERFFSLLYWVSDDYPKRKAFVKSGMKAWIEKWDKVSKSQFERKNSKPSRFHGKNARSQNGKPRDKQNQYNRSPQQNRRNDSRKDRPSRDQRDHRAKRQGPSSGPRRDDRKPRDNHEQEGSQSEHLANRKKYSSVSNDPKNKFF